MSQPAVSALVEPLPFELVFDDGEPMENRGHVVQRDLLMDLTAWWMGERGRNDYFACGNLFVYYSIEQARDVAMGRPYFCGPDFFFVDRVSRRRRQGWVAWEEGGRLPDLIIEFLSPSTEKIDRQVKMDLYSRVFRTPEYFLHSFEGRLEGYQLDGDRYRPMRPDSRGRFRSHVLGLDLGVWHGLAYHPVNQREDGLEGHWVRFFDVEGRLIPQPIVVITDKLQAAQTQAEAAQAQAEVAQAQAEAAQAQAEAAQAGREVERRRAEAAEAELQRLRALLGEAGRQD
ncbi:MAG TPA: Uma2 family endonuclease [Thermoanaerobaculia bacterium]|nr:Uma2 family endonuclease [Thermoanaerobaculia bacterium]